MSGVNFNEERRLKGEGRMFFCFILSSIFYLLLSVSFCGCSLRPYQSQARLIMGAVIEITAQDKKAIDAAFSEIERVAALLDTANPASEISRLNQEGWQEVAPETLAIIKAAKKMYAVSDGAFNIADGALRRLWNIRENTPKGQASVKIPQESRIKDAISCVGLNFVEIDEKNSIIRLKKKGVILDLSFIAKGYAIDRALLILKHSRVRSALINAGGEIYCLNGKGLFGWGVSLPGEHNVSAGRVLRLRNRAVATVGSNEQYFIYNNRRTACIIDSRTGYPVDNGIISVTVLADDCMTAEAMAAAIFILGKDKGRALAARFKNIEAEILTK